MLYLHLFSSFFIFVFIRLLEYQILQFHAFLFYILEIKTGLSKKLTTHFY